MCNPANAEADLHPEAEESASAPSSVPVARGPHPLAGSAAIGLLVWLGLRAGPQDIALRLPLLDWLILLSPLVIFPLAIRWVWPRDREGELRYTWAVWPIIIAAFALPVAFYQSSTTARLLWGTPWILITFSAAIFGVLRRISRPARCIEESCFDAGLVYLAVGGAWLGATLYGLEPMGFQEPIVELTAAHFHYAGFATLFITGGLGRLFFATGSPGTRHRIYRATAGALIALPILVGLGIALSPTLELIASLATVLAAWTLALLMVFVAPGRFRRWPSRILISMSGGAIILTMGFAAMYAWGHLMDTPHPDIATMIAVHGLGNAVGFALLGVLALTLDVQPSRPAAPGIPFSRIRSGWHIGSDFFDRNDLVDPERAQPQGLVDNLDEYAFEGFDPSQVKPEIRHFYEHTGRFRIYVQPHWSKAFSVPAKAFRYLSRRWQQIGLPLDPISDREMQSRLVPIRDRRDGRTGVRAWIRTYLSDGSVVYAAAYAVHRHFGVPYMNIAFPLLGGHMTSVLRMNPLGSGLSLTTLPIPDHGGDQGVYFVWRGLTLRLPFNETIDVIDADHASVPEFPGDDPNASVFARHDMWLWGIRFLTLHYWLSDEAQ